MGKAVLLTSTRERRATHPERRSECVGVERLARVVNAVRHDRERARPEMRRHRVEHLGGG
jgi:ABC-type ATPase with predicted acetyltransferase domain